jgi:alkylation response protein AidB-like acyl-CoA dehydrogenase
MDVGLNSGQLALRDSVRSVLRAECPPGVARQAMTDPERWRTVWETVVDLGWTELAAPATDDSSSGRVELAIVLEEPDAGSDFAGLRTRAERDRPDSNAFRVNGRKIWTTQADLSRWCTLYARTDPAAPKHRGISNIIAERPLGLPKG